jgi:hypothetical protein
MEAEHAQRRDGGAWGDEDQHVYVAVAGDSSSVPRSAVGRLADVLSICNAHGQRSANSKDTLTVSESAEFGTKRHCLAAAIALGVSNAWPEITEAL